MVKRKEVITERARKGPKRKKMKVGKGARADPKYERSHERFTWKGVLYAKKRFKILPPPRQRDEIEVVGSCAWLSMASALEAANRACGIEVGQLSWEDLYEMVAPEAPCRITACLRALKYKGMRTRADYLQGNTEAKRYKISQYTEFCNLEVMDEVVSCGLDKENIKAAIDNGLSKSPMICHFPVSENYFDFEDEMEHIYRYDETQRRFTADGRTASHVAVVTGFGFEEDTPYFQFLDCNGNKFGKKGFCKILPSSIISLYAFDIVQD